MVVVEMLQQQLDPTFVVWEIYKAMPIAPLVVDDPGRKKGGPVVLFVRHVAVFFKKVRRTGKEQTDCDKFFFWSTEEWLSLD